MPSWTLKLCLKLKGVQIVHPLTGSDNTWLIHKIQVQSALLKCTCFVLYCQLYCVFVTKLYFVFDVFAALEYIVSIISDQVSIIIPQDYFWMETSVSVCLLADRDGPHLTFKIPPCSMQWWTCMEQRTLEIRQSVWSNERHSLDHSSGQPHSLSENEKRNVELAMW